MRTAVVGPGGVGAYLAARLSASERADISVVGRGPHLWAIRDEGLRLHSPHGDLHVRPHATDDPAAIGPVDLVLLAVKATDVPAAAAAMHPLIGHDTLVVTFQNGVDSHLQVAEAVGADRVLPGVAYIFSTVTAPGVVTHTAGPGRFVFGEPAGPPRHRTHRLRSFLAAADVEAEVVEDIEVALWSKFAIICSTAGVTAPSRLSIDVLRAEPATRRLFEQLSREVVTVGRAQGVALPDDAVQTAMAFIDQIGPDAYSSLLYDLLNGKPMELEALHGTVVRLADAAGVDVPATRTVHALLAPWARRNSSGGASHTRRDEPAVAAGRRDAQPTKGEWDGGRPVVETEERPDD